MNRVFQVVWSDDVGAWVVVSELASRRRKARRVDARTASSATPSIRRTLLAFGLIAGAPFAGLHAQSLHWDGTDTNANANGGNGTWQDGATNWDSAATAGANTAWNSTIPNDAVFGIGAGTVTIAPAGVTAHNLTFNTANYIIGGGALTLGGINPTISNGGMATISSVIAGTNGMTKRGAGIATLSGAGDFTGGTRLQGGALEIAGTLATPTLHMGAGTTLRVTGTVGAGAGATQLSGTGQNIVVVATGGQAALGGGLGGGDDVLDIAGTLDTLGGTLALGDGDDLFRVEDGAHVVGTIDGGAGHDTIETDIATTADLGAADHFDGLLKSGIGVLHVQGPAPSAFGVVNLQGGTLHVGNAGALVDVAQLTVAGDTTLRIDGRVAGTAGDDLADVGGRIEGTGLLDFGDGDDRLLLHGNADTSSLANAIDGGAGIDTIDAQIDTGVETLGAMVRFESLSKQGDGELRLASDESFDVVQVLAGILSVDSDHALTAQHTMLAADATLRVDGAFHGTQADDTFVAAGTIIGALDFGDGNDAVTFADANIAGMTSLAGGAGADRLVFDGMTFDGDALANVSGFEHAMLANGSTLSLSLSQTLALDVLAIDATSSLLASAGARIDGAVENAGTLRVDSGRLAIAGDYTGTAGATLVLAVSPANGTSGGLDIVGDVHGTTQIAFDSDGSVVTGPTAIKIIDSPNDVPGEGTFTATRTRDGFVRLTGSVFNWGFAQDLADGDWYLRTEASDGAQGLSLLPEIPAYGALPTIGALAARSASGLAFAHMERIDAECRGDAARSNLAHRDDCHRAWVAATADEVTVGANPGVAFSGDTTGLYVGADIFGHDTATHTVRGGVFAGQQRGNHWTTGVTSGGLQGVGGANVRTETPAFGMYGRVEWQGGMHLDGSAIGQLHGNNIATTDGFREKIAARSVAMNLRGGREFTLASGWKLDPQLALGAYGMRWQDKVDASGKPLAFEDDVIGTAHASLRVERAFVRPGGATWRPWATLGVEDTFGANADAVRVGQVAVEQSIPNHAWDLGATLDAGVEFASNAHVSWFGSVSLGESLDGTDLSRGQAMLGARVRW